MTASAAALAARLVAPLTVCDPDTVGALTVFPLITDTNATLEYVAFAQGFKDGVAIKELGTGASVNDLVVHNPLDVAILLYDGEEVLGAQQNRTFDQSVLVGARSDITVPVSCVEAGRWDHTRHDEALAPAPQAAYPELRRRKNAAVRERLAAGGDARAEQREVWAEVAAKATRMGGSSPTGAMHDVFERRRDQLAAIEHDVPHYCSQVGALVAIGGRFVVLDYVSDVDAFGALHGPLVAGYGLDALEADAGVASPSIDDARDFVDLLLNGEPVRTPSVGLGESLRFDFGGLAGTGLEHDGEVVTLTAFSQDGPPHDAPEHPASARVARPSRRRRS